jgi:hypothetical protein
MALEFGVYSLGFGEVYSVTCEGLGFEALGFRFLGYWVLGVYGLGLGFKI